MIYDYALLRTMVKAACSLNEREAISVNPEYVRGQAELICDVTGVPMEYREEITDTITGCISLYELQYRLEWAER